MSAVFLAIDVGGSTTRAVLVDEAGRCLGQGRNKGGNPASNSPDEAASAMISAVAAAVSQAGGGPLEIGLCLIALAGPKVRLAIERL
jgi:N-acetylglucosamine kinase-like BadF-type ATPase